MDNFEQYTVNDVAHYSTSQSMNNNVIIEVNNPPQKTSVKDEESFPEYSQSIEQEVIVVKRYKLKK